MKKNVFNKILLLAVTVLLIGLSDAFCFDVDILPDNKIGGEAILIRINGSSLFKYKVLFEGKEYVPYKNGNGSREIQACRKRSGIARKSCGF